MSEPSLVKTQVQQHGSRLLDELQTEAKEVAAVGGQAAASLAWLWPLRGLLYTLFRA
jgi:hypothetical protein